ncbi:MAG TPA: sigma-70 family RNA polymerase sigma factor [Pirellulales bacterium]
MAEYVETTEEQSREDDQLMDRLQKGDRRAFDELVRRHQPSLRSFFLVRSTSARSRQQADDLAQDVLLKIYNEADKFVPQQKFRAWMFRIARNLLIDRARRDTYDALGGGRQSGDDEQLGRVACDSAQVVDVANTKTNADMIAALLDELPEEQMLTFKAHIFLGLSLPEVAEVMETNTATTKSRLRLAREKLQEKLAERGVRFSDDDFE